MTVRRSEPREGLLVFFAEAVGDSIRISSGVLLRSELEIETALLYTEEIQQKISANSLSFISNPIEQSASEVGLIESSPDFRGSNSVEGKQYFLTPIRYGSNLCEDLHSNYVSEESFNVITHGEFPVGPDCETEFLDLRLGVKYADTSGSDLLFYPITMTACGDIHCPSILFSGDVFISKDGEFTRCTHPKTQSELVQVSGKTGWTRIKAGIINKIPGINFISELEHSQQKLGYVKYCHRCERRVVNIGSNQIPAEP